MKKNKLLTPAISLVILFAAIYVLIKMAGSGSFEKELIPLYTEPKADWIVIHNAPVKTHWQQDSYYARYSPSNELLGCWSVAFAQVLAYHRLQPTGVVTYMTTGNIPINEKLIPVNWEEIVPVIDDRTLPERSSATARYCFQAALVLQKDFGSGEYKDISIVSTEVSEHYACKVRKEELNLVEIINNELLSKRPVVAYFDDILGIKVVRNGHAVVIDGFAQNNNQTFVHVNFGWGGKSDGWYDFKTLSMQRRLKYVFTISCGNN